MTTRRLGRGDEQRARELFAVMAAVFEEAAEPLSDEYLGELLGSSSFWAIAAIEDDRVVGGITAHTIPMTRSASAELLVYDLAVHEDHRRRGIGGHLVAVLREQAAEAGIAEVFVPVDDEDVHALEFYRSQGGHESPVSFFTWDTRADSG